jgi:hypothetical protein
MRRTAAQMVLVAASAAAALALAGCGGSGRAPATTAGGKPADGGQAAYRYAACMRNHGVANFPDPKVTVGNGSVKVAMMVTPAITGQASFKSAQRACQRILPGPGNLSPAQVAAQQRQHRQTLLAFARCLRAHGLTHFPDPTAQGQLTLAMIDAAGIDLHQPGVLTAAKACIGVTHGAITGADVERAIGQQQ